MSSFKDFVNEYKPFLGLLIFGNIENLILAAQGVAAGVNPLGLAILCLILVVAVGYFRSSDDKDKVQDLDKLFNKKL